MWRGIAIYCCLGALLANFLWVPQTSPAFGACFARGAYSLQALSPNEHILYLLWEYETNDSASRGNHSILFKRSLDTGQSFEQTVAISEGPSHCFKNPKMVASGDNIYVVWQDYNATTGTEYVMFSSSQNSGRTFTEPYSLGRGFLLSLGVGYYGPEISRTNKHLAAEGGNFYAIWLDFGSASGVYQLKFISGSDGGKSIGEPKVLIEAEYDEIHSAALVSSGSNVHVSWVNGTRTGSESTDPLEHLLMTRSSHDSGRTFGEPQVVHVAYQHLPIIPDLAASGNNLFLVWTQEDDLMFSKSDDAGNSFTSPLIISSNQHRPEGASERYIFQSYPYITTFEEELGSGGPDVIVAWIDMEENSDRHELSIVRSLDAGSTFRTPQRFGFYGPLPPIHNTVAVTSDGTLHYPYRESMQDSLNMWVITFAISQVYGMLLSNDTGGWSSTPSLAANGSTLHAVWLNGTDNSIRPGSDVVQQIYVASSADSGRTYTRPAIYEEIVTVPEFGQMIVIVTGIVLGGIILWTKGTVGRKGCFGKGFGLN